MLRIIAPFQSKIMPRPRRIAIVINLDWTMKHHQEVFAGTQKYAKEHGWESVLWPFPPDVVDARGRKLYDGIIGRVHPELAERAGKARIPPPRLRRLFPHHEFPTAATRAAGDRENERHQDREPARVALVQ
jgi:hypothetical protein